MHYTYLLGFYLPFFFVLSFSLFFWILFLIYGYNPHLSLMIFSLQKYQSPELLFKLGLPPSIDAKLGLKISEDDGLWAFDDIAT